MQAVRHLCDFHPPKKNLPKVDLGFGMREALERGFIWPGQGFSWMEGVSGDHTQDCRGSFAWDLRVEPGIEPRASEGCSPSLGLLTFPPASTPGSVPSRFGVQAQIRPPHACAQHEVSGCKTVGPGCLERCRSCLSLPSAPGSVDSNWIVGATLEKKLPPLPLTLALGAFLNHRKNKFQCGFGLTIG